MRETDLEKVLRWRNHPDVRKCMLSQHEITLAEHRAWFERSVKDATRALLVVEEDDLAIGCVVFSNVSYKGATEWSFYVDPNSGPGTGKKVCMCGLGYAFDLLNINSVLGRVLATNIASIRLHARLGFTRIEDRSEKLLINKKSVELHFFELKKSKFQNSRNFNDQN